MKYVNLLDVAKIKNQKVQKFNGTKLYIATGDVDEKGIQTSTKITYEDRPSRANVEVRNGQVIFARMKATKKVLLIDEVNNKYVYSTGFCVLEPSDEVIPSYLRLILKSSIFQDQKDKFSKGATQKAINNQGIKKIRIPVTSLEKQESIVEVMNQAQVLIDTRKEQIIALSDLKKSIFYDMFGDPQLNPKRWEMGKIRDLTNKTQYGSSKKASLTEGEFPMLRMNNITYKGEVILDDLKYIDLDEKEQEKYLVHKGQLLFNRTNSKELVGKTAVYNNDKPIAYAGYLIKLIPNELANSYFISGYLNSDFGKRYLFNLAKNIVGMANINAKELQAIPIYMPPIDLQNKYEHKIKKIDRTIDSLKQSQTEYEILYKSLMHKAFKGELF